MHLQRSALLVAVVVGLGTPASAAGFGVDDRTCRDLLANVENNLPGSVPSDLDGQRLETARDFLQQAKLCINNPLMALSPNKALLDEGLREATEQVRVAAELQDTRQLRAALFAEGNELAARLAAGNGTAADEAAVATWRARVEAGARKNPQFDPTTLAGVQKKIEFGLAKGKENAARGVQHAQKQVLIDGAVVTRLPGFTVEDSLSPLKVLKAFEQLDPATLVVTTDVVDYNPAGLRGTLRRRGQDAAHARHVGELDIS